MAEGETSGRQRCGLDTSIAAANDCVVVTDNERDLPGIEIINPLRGTP